MIQAWARGAAGDGEAGRVDEDAELYTEVGGDFAQRGFDLVASNVVRPTEA